MLHFVYKVVRHCVARKHAIGLRHPTPNPQKISLCSLRYMYYRTANFMRAFFGVNIFCLNIIILITTRTWKQQCAQDSSGLSSRSQDLFTLSGDNGRWLLMCAALVGWRARTLLSIRVRLHFRWHRCTDYRSHCGTRDSSLLWDLVQFTIYRFLSFLHHSSALKFFLINVSFLHLKKLSPNRIDGSRHFYLRQWKSLKLSSHQTDLMHVRAF